MRRWSVSLAPTSQVKRSSDCCRSLICEQLFFDDEPRNKEVESLGSSCPPSSFFPPPPTLLFPYSCVSHIVRLDSLRTLLVGVTMILVSSAGTTMDLFESGLATWRKKYGRE